MIIKEDSWLADIPTINFSQDKMLLIEISCRKEYIGETKRALGTILKEHQVATRWGETEKSAIAETCRDRRSLSCLG